MAKRRKATKSLDDELKAQRRYIELEKRYHQIDSELESLKPGESDRRLLNEKDEVRIEIASLVSQWGWDRPHIID